MAKAKKKSGSIKSQVLLLAGVLVVLMGVSTIATLVAVGKIELVSQDTNPIGYIGDAEQVCNERVRRDQGVALNAMAVDDHSSFFDEKSGKYKMFYEISVYNDASRQSGVKTFYVNCMVAGASGSIKRMEYLEQKDFKPKAIRRKHGNIFGF